MYKDSKAVEDRHEYNPLYRAPNAAQQSVHPTLGILARFQTFFYASAFFQSDGVPPPAPARVTQTVRRHIPKGGDRDDLARNKALM